MSTKPKQPGSINPCGRSFLYDGKGNHVATTLDAPNPLAYAFKVCKDAVEAWAFYGFFPAQRTAREDVENRFHFVNEKDHGKHLEIHQTTNQPSS